jgi:hypothetical protein
MTRDEAIKIWRSVHNDGDVIDALVKFGAIKLNESAVEKLAKEFRNRLANPPPADDFLIYLRDALDCAGLKIVEK